MKTAIAHITKRVLPERYWVHLQSIRSRNRQMRWLQDNGVLDRTHQFVQANGSTVLGGPFAGMKYPTSSALSRHSVPRLLGSYECELHATILEALNQNYDRVVDIGSAEGYYTVGFALKGKSPVVAFEADPREMELCKEMARINRVLDRITPRALCDPVQLSTLANGLRCFVLSDCEGYEAELFDGATVLALRRSDVLIELHKDARETLVARFSKTHRVEIIEATPRSANPYPALACLGSGADLAICEFRNDGQRWLSAKPLECAAR